MSQTRLAIMAGISREHLNRIEAGKVTLTDDMKDKLMEAVEKFNPDAPMFLLFDYVRIRFPTLDIQHVIKDILKLNIDYMLHEDYGHYKYTEHTFVIQRATGTVRHDLSKRERATHAVIRERPLEKSLCHDLYSQDNDTSQRWFCS